MLAVFWQERFIIIVSDYSMTSEGKAQMRSAPEAINVSSALSVSDIVMRVFDT